MISKQDNCNQVGCTEKAIKKIVHLGTEEVFYCPKHLTKYCLIMEAMGSPMPIVYDIH